MTEEQAQLQDPNPAESAPESVTEQPAVSAPAEPETHSPPEQQEQDGQPRKGGVQRRIDELTRDKRLAQAEVEFWKQKAIGEKPEATPAKPSAEPDPADFQTDEDYRQALRIWDREQIKAEVKAEIEQFGRQQQERSETEQRAADWNKKAHTVKESHADYDEVTNAAVAQLGTLKGPAVQALAHALQYSEAGPELLYHLGQNQEELEKLAGMHPTQAVIALGRLEARLTTEKPAPAGSEAKAAPHTSAPKPPTPIRKTSPGSSPKPDEPGSDKLSDDEWLAARNKQLRERASSR